MTDYKKYINALRKCAKEHDNDITFTGHIIVSDLCRDTANLLEELEHKADVLEQIRAEIEQTEINGYIRDVECFRAGINTALNVIDKYKAERTD